MIKIKKIENIEKDTEELLEENIKNRELIEEQGKDINQLKEELKKAIEKFENVIDERLKHENQEQRKGFDSRGRPLPDQMIEEVDWEDIDFIYGKSPNEPYFMIVASSRDARQAKRESDRLKDKGHDVGVVYNTERRWYYVFLETPGDIESGLETLYQLRSEDPDNFGDAWIHVYR